MNAKLLLVPLSTLLLSASGLSMAASGVGGDTYAKAQPERHDKGSSGMGGMMGHGAKGSDMMGACPMMGGRLTHGSENLHADARRNDEGDG